MLRKWIKSVKYRLEKDIDEAKMKELVESGAILVDVRSPQEYQEGHFYGAICMPSYEIQVAFPRKFPNKDKKAVLYCSSGIRSKQAQKKLEKLGYKNIYNLCKPSI